MEKDERYSKCLPFSSRQGKKALFVFVVINIVVILFIFFKSSHLSNLSYESKFNTVKPEYTSIYHVPLFHIPYLNAKDMAPFYIEIKTDSWCFREGVNLLESKKNKKCICVNNWFGLDCGIPAAVWNSSYLQDGMNGGIEIRRRDKPRRIIVSFAVDDHIELLDINIHNTFSVVDLFLTVEERDHSPSILNMFKAGYLIECQSKIIPIQLNKSIEYKTNNWSILMLNELWTIGWKKLANFRPDDIFLFSHVSSIVSKDVLLFLKLYDGFPEPFSFELRPLLFKFWRQIKINNSNSKLIPFRPLGCTFQYIASMCDFDVMKFLTNNCLNDLHHRKAFEKSHWPLKAWSIGRNYSFSGWQCNLCCRKECVQKNVNKYVSFLTNGTSFSSLNYLGNTSVIEEAPGIDLFSKYISFKIISGADTSLAPSFVLGDQKYSFLLDLNPVGT